jgi:response regulator RpfG family c-di-GMP phosphodiesterase
MITALDSASTAIEMIKLGVYDYIVKPFNLQQVLVSANRGLDKRRLESAAREYQRYLEQTAEERAAETRRLFYATTRVLLRLLELKAPFTNGHAHRVAEMARHVARALKMTDDGVRKVYLAGLLHDTGLLAMADPVLDKRGPITARELREIRDRMSAAEDVLKPILEDDEVLKHIRHRSERYDGEGQPDGLRGKFIPLGARIIAVVEAFDAMTRDRPYRAAVTPAEAIEELKRCAGTQFDQQVVTVFADLHAQILAELNSSAAQS